MTNVLEYSEGELYLVAGEVVSCLTPDAGLARQVWPAVASGESMAAVLTELLATGLANLPDLALFEATAGDVRVLLRGDLSTSVVLADGSQRSGSGVGVSTWSEYAFPGARSGSIARPGATTLPVALGIVKASGFAFSLPGDPAGKAPMVAAAVTKPAPAKPPVMSEPSMIKRAEPEVVAGSAAVNPPPVEPPIPLSSAAVTSDAPAPRPNLAETRAEAPDTSFRHLFESTILRTVEDAAVRDADQVEAPPPPMISAVPPVGPAVDITPSSGSVSGMTEPRLGDHDGSTIMAGQLAALRTTSASRPAAPNGGSAATVLVLRDGQRLNLDRPVVFGRRPQADRVSGADLPQLITVSSPNQDISRNHLQVSQSGGEVVARDLHATNGSLLRRADGEVVEIANGAEVAVVAGDALDLGDGVLVRVEAR